MAASTPTDTETTVKALFDAAKLHMSDDEFAMFVRTYPPMRAGADGLYIPETRYEEHTLIFDPAWDLRTQTQKPTHKQKHHNHQTQQPTHQRAAHRGAAGAHRAPQ